MPSTVKTYDKLVADGNPGNSSSLGTSLMITPSISHLISIDHRLVVEGLSCTVHASSSLRTFANPVFATSRHSLPLPPFATLYDMALQADDAAMAGLAEAQLHQAQSINEKAAAADVKRSHSAHSSYDVEDQVVHPDAPTAEELATLRRVPDSVAPATYLIGLIEFAERFSYYGTTVVFTNFIQQPLPAGSTTGSSHAGQTSGALGMGQQASTGLTTFNSFWVYCTPLLGAYIADTYLGRYQTICWAVLIAIIGHILLVICAIPSVISNPQGSLAAFAIAIIIMGLGTGAFKSNISPLIAEQSTNQHARVKVLKNGTKVILDPAMTAGRIFMYFYLMVNVGALVGQIGMAYAEKRVGFWLSYLLPTLVLMMCPIILWIGRNRYVKLPPTGSIMSTCFRLIRHAGKGKWMKPKQLTDASFWEGSKPSNIPVDQRPKWMTFDDAYVAEVRRGLKACKVFVWYPLWWLTYNQCNNNLVSQAATMNTHGLPNDILSNLDPFALIIFIPVCDLFLYPALRRANIKFTPIKKITFGFLVGALAMLCAAVTQHFIYKTHPCGYNASECDLDPNYSPLNVWIQTPSYVLIAFSEIFASITGLEYAFTKAPKSMRSLVTAVFLFTSAISSAIGEAFLPISTDPLLVWNYGVMGVLSFVGGVGFWLSFRHLDAEEYALNDLPVGVTKATFTEEERAHEK